MNNVAASIRVLFFVSEYDRLHGGQRSLLQLVRHLPALGVEPVVAFPARGRCTAAYESVGVRVEIVPGFAAASEFGQHLLRLSLLRKAHILIRQILPYSFKLVGVMKRLDLHILHCNTTRSLLFAGAAARLHRYPIVWHVRGQIRSFSPAIRLTCESLVSHIILVAMSLRQEIHPWFRHKCRTIYNGIDEGSFLNNDAHLPTLPCAIDGRPVIITMAAVTPFKGYHHLLEAARLLNKQPLERRPIFFAIGELFDQSYLAYLQRLLGQYELDNFYFLGWQQNPLPYYHLADVVVLPTVEREQLEIGGARVEVYSGEGFSRAVLEAMYVGKPVIATRVAGASEQIVDGETGRLVSPGNPEALAAALLQLLQAPATVRQEMGQKAARRARERFTSTQMAQETAALYRTLVAHAC